MSSHHRTKSSPGSLWPKALSLLLSQDWLILLPDLYRLLRHWWRRYSREGMYEIIEYNSTLELLDPKGKQAIFKKQQRVKFLQDYINTFQDYAWGDGQIFAAYHCSPGTVVDRYQEGDRWNILISLRETKNSNDITDFYIERTVKNGFTQAEEARQVEIRHHTRHLRLNVIFPKKRPCQRAVLLQRSRHRSRVLGPEHFVTLPDGRQKLTWETTKIRRFEIYTLKWSW